jgi:hypothetical protein
MRRPARAALFTLLALFAARASADTRWFRSNEMGLAIELIPRLRTDEFTWVLSVERTASGGGWVETRRLLNGGAEERRWTLVRSADGRTEEREEREGVIAARRLSGAAGELLQEELFEAGRPSSRSVFEYASGRLVRSRVFAADGSLSSMVEYRMAPSGRLREVRWTAADGSLRTVSQAAGGTGSVAAGSAVSEERAREGDGWRTTRYDETGRAAVHEQGGPDGLVSRQRLVYAGGSLTPVSSKTEWPAEKKVVETFYDAAGGAISETTTVAGAVTERVAWTRDETGRVLVMRRSGTGGTTEVRNTWAADGTLEREEHFVRGARAKNVIHTATGERVEELFEDGELFLRVLYRGEERIREEVILDGTVVRERTFAP